MVNKTSFLPTLTLLFGFAFLYAPIVILIIFSFNAGKLVSVWAGFSTQWYGELLHNEQILRAAWVSIKIAVVNATIATILGTLGAYGLSRFGAFKGRTLFTGMMTAPLVMPDVITGLATLLLFVGIGWTRGMSTITIAHITFSLAFVAVIVRARVSALDQSLEEAAMDLGARPVKTFIVITIPMLAPALVAGWLLAFTLSLDDLVIASFVAGPGASTLPMVVFSKVRLGVSPEINALGTLIVLLVALCIAVAAWIFHRQEQERLRDQQAAERG
ncbi:MAG: Inner membrane ABC transporter permease protein YdcV [Gammaproteobacteria bacterium]|nr:Inner membrane ABC transporter permease protein YdcV [Gammaproteobacteria bacterium]